MKRSIGVLVVLVVSALLMWGCDASNLPTPVPSPTPIETATALPTQTVPPTATSIPSSVTRTGTPTITLTPAIEEPVFTATPDLDPPTFAPAQEPPPTPNPQSLTPNPQAPDPSPRPPTPTTVSEPPPTGGWREVVRAAPGKRQVALTFDAGGTGEDWQKVMAALREHNVHVTMFFTGKFAEKYPDAIRQAVADGHELANHTYDHLSSLQLTDAQLIEELSRTEELIRGLTGVSTKPYWRAPYGERNNHILNVAVSQGYRSIVWTLDSLDSVGQPKTPSFVLNRVTNTPGLDLDGAIVLQHFGFDSTVQALPAELTRLDEMGLKVVTISELLSP